MSLITGTFVILFSASIAIVLFVFSFLQRYPFSARTDPSKFHRRRGLSNRTKATVFVATVINFLLSSLNTGSELAAFVVFMRKALILDIDYPLSPKSDNASRTVTTTLIALWAQNIPVNGNLSLPDPVSNNAWCRCWSAILSSFGGLGPSSQIASG